MDMSFPLHGAALSPTIIVALVPGFLRASSQDSRNDTFYGKTIVIILKVG